MPTTPVRLLLLVTLVFGVTSRSAAQVDTSEWLCEFCPFDAGYQNAYEAGASAVSDGAARFGNATGYDRNGVFLELGASGRFVADGYRLAWQLEDLGVDARRGRVAGGRQGQYKFYAAYSELPHRRFDTTTTVFESDESGTLSLPSPWVSGSTTAALSALETSLRHRNIGSDRHDVDAGAVWLPTEKLRLFADYNRQSRDGNKLDAGASYTHATLLPNAFEYQTNRVDLGFQYRMERSILALAYYGSFFSNRDIGLAWEMPFTTAPGAERLQIAQAPDNRFQQLSVSATFRPELWHSVVAVQAATGRGVQDDTLLPNSINPNVPGSALPRSSAAGAVDTGNYTLTVSARPTSKARIKLAYRYAERDNETVVSDWSRIIVDLFDSGEIEQNIPYGFKRESLNLSVELRLRKDLRIAAGYDRTEKERNFQEVAEQSEDSGWGQLRWQPATWLDLRTRAGTSKREIDRYDTSIAESLGQNPLLRKYNLAYRFRKFGEISAIATIPEYPISISATILKADDNYTRSPLGMTGSNELRYTADLSWVIKPTLSTYLTIGSEILDADQLGSEQGLVADWQATHEDRFDNLGAGFRWQPTSGKLDLRLDYTHGIGQTNIVVSGTNTSLNPLPDLGSDLDSLRLAALYRWSDKFSSTLNLRYESFGSDDWALQDLEPDTLPTVLSIGARPYDYGVWMIGISFQYLIGDQKSTPAN